MAADKLKIYLCMYLAKQSQQIFIGGKPEVILVLPFSVKRLTYWIYK
ncbi:hypothetical protein CCACVL1_19122 [Corchorus capsularis]|uniref:Uncharacterized protein n=1 Tax=Corchorus capsularis TaxID=210143 RepID=A0A1R3HI81_COCAP|nr:hypothetical protein CCACVL1_19122 [Corchorus capsularis]